MYWFITFEEDNKRRVQKTHEITTMHPLVWLDIVSNRYPDNRYYILFWQQIPDEIGRKYYDNVP